jgi:type III pantothenate kinase
VYLVDIGNRYAHLYDGSSVTDLEYNELFKQYKDSSLYYINVNPDIKKLLESNSNWIDIEPFVKLDGSYSGMGIDRKVLLLSCDDGIYIDEFSAITEDLKKDNSFVGGTILPGLWRVKESYKEISSILAIDKINSIDISTLPNSTTSLSVSYGIIAPIVALVEKINSKNLPIYCTGGDGELLSKYLDAKFDKYLVFKGMQKVIKEIKC